MSAIPARALEGSKGEAGHAGGRGIPGCLVIDALHSVRPSTVLTYIMIVAGGVSPLGSVQVLESWGIGES